MGLNLEIVEPESEVKVCEPWERETSRKAFIDVKEELRDE